MNEELLEQRERRRRQRVAVLEQLIELSQGQDLEAELQRINRRLWARVEGECHRNPHRGFDGGRPAEGWATCSDDVRLPDGDTSELFLFEQKRRVQGCGGKLSSVCAVKHYGI